MRAGRVTSRTTMRAFRSRSTGSALAFVALFGVLLSPYCDVFDTHGRDAPGALVKTQSDRAETVVHSESTTGLVDHDDATTCCAVIAGRPTATSAGVLAPANGIPKLAIAAAHVPRRAANLRVRHWHTRVPGPPPTAVLHARSAPLLS